MNGIQNTSTNNFGTIIGNNKKFVVPMFQRGDRNPNDQETPFNALAMQITQEKKVSTQLLQPIVVEDKVFENSFSDKSFPYNSRNAKIVRYILAAVEKHNGFTSSPLTS